jgi:hypothetical protein
MTSLISATKQVPANAGYYIPVADCRLFFYANNGTDSAPSFGQMVSTMSTSGARVSSLIASAGAGVFKDMGKTVGSSARVFRKVQLLAGRSTDVTEGVAGAATAPTSYLTGYIELPGTHGLSSGSANYTPVARLG